MTEHDYAHDDGGQQSEGENTTHGQVLAKKKMAGNAVVHEATILAYYTVAYGEIMITTVGSVFW